MNFQHLYLSGLPQSALDSTANNVARLTLRSLRMLPVWVSPDHLVSTARFVMNGHRLPLLPVCSPPELIGYVTVDELAKAGPEQLVGEFARPFGVVLDADLDVRAAASEFVDHDLSTAPVVADGKFIGMVTATDLLREMSQTWDPLTELPWTDRLREWGIGQLSAGNEITIIALDLDDFALYNRKFGHSEGDRMIRALANALSGGVDPDRDFLVRSGGDEFLIGTLRLHDEAMNLATQLREDCRRLPGVQGEAGFSVGISGGKRGRDREFAHFGAMLDNLIKLAQLDCLARKRLKPTVIEAIPDSSDLHRSQEFEVIAATRQEEPVPITQVIVRVGSRILGGTDSGANPDLAAAGAAARALESWSRSLKFEIETVQAFEDASGGRLISVVGRVDKDGSEQRFSGVAKYERDRLTAVAQAFLDGFVRLTATEANG